MITMASSSRVRLRPPVPKVRGNNRKEVPLKKGQSLRDLLSLFDICKLFHRSPQTIINWRTYEALPTVVIPGNLRGTIRFDRKAVLKWATEKGKKTYPGIV